MIPKTIHYCWFGHGPMPEDILKCIESWHKYMPEWKYMLWSEENFDVDSVPYVKEAFDTRRFAFVADYVRLYALYTQGGVYLDCDINVFKSFDDLLHYKAFAGFEGSKYTPIMGAMMASEAGGVWVKEQLDEYSGLHFINADGTLNVMTNTVRITERMKKDGFVPNGEEKAYKDLHVFPSDYFCPRQTTGEYYKTKNTYCDHIGICSWDMKFGGWKDFILGLCGKNISASVIKLKRKLLG